MANGVVYVGGFDGRLYAFDPGTGAKLWSAKTSSAIKSSPAISDGVVYVGSEDKHLYAFALNAGNDAAYKGVARPSYSALHPDFRLKPAR